MRKHLFKFTFLLAFGLMGRFAGAQAPTTLTFTHNQPAELQADAGPDQTICDDQTATLGGNPTANGGTSPFTYAWTPTTDLSSATVANPDVTPTGAPSSVDYSIVVTDDRGCTSADTSTLNVDTCTSVANVDGVGYSTIFPNPSNGNFAVDVKLQKHSEQAVIRVMNTEGKVVYTRNVTPVQNRIREDIKLTGISKGTYIVNIELDGAKLTHQLIVQ